MTMHGPASVKRIHYLQVIQLSFNGHDTVSIVSQNATDISTEHDNQVGMFTALCTTQAPFYSQN
jgi:hypothetical protein